MEREHVLAHHGIKGQRWGIRRFQNKDGSLTAAGKKRRRSEKPEEEPETPEQKKARLLKSTDASELYRNRSMLTTAEINERLNRIDTERRLSEVAAKSRKSWSDRVDQALKAGKKVNEAYEFMNTPVMKAVRKKLGFDKDEPKPTLEQLYRTRDKRSDKELNDALKRAATEEAIRKILEGRASKP